MPTANEVCKLARSFSQEALETLVKMMRNAELPGAVRIKAAEAVLNRGIGCERPTTNTNRLPGSPENRYDLP